MTKVLGILGFSCLLLVACSDAEKVSTDSNGNGFSKSEASCCLNERFYDCKGDGDKAQQCFDNGDPGECERDEGNDDACKSDDDEGGEGEGEGEGEDDDFDDF